MAMNRPHVSSRRLHCRGLGLVVALRVMPRNSSPRRPKRVGLIGCGWYGKCDLFRLIQVAPVEVVSLCDVDSKMLAEAAEIDGQPARPRRRSPGPTATTARCSRRKTSTSS